MVTRNKRTGVCGWCVAGAVVLGLGSGAGLWPTTVAFAAADAPTAAKDAGQGQSSAAQLTKSYLAIQALLAQDKTDGVGAEWKKLRASATVVAETSKDATVKERAGAVVKAVEREPKDLKEARASFKPLSAAVIRLVELTPQAASAGPLYEVSCPMAEASWLQTSKDISNPYMGKEMLDCGKVERKVEPGQPRK